jgi:hypothetical protein
MFTSYRIRTAAALLTAGLSLGSFVSAAAAAAAPVDDQFLYEIDSAGIPYDSPAVAISNAHTVCDTLSAGQSLMSLGRQLYKMADWTPEQAGMFVFVSVNAYCPENHDNLRP